MIVLSKILYPISFFFCLLFPVSCLLSPASWNDDMMKPMNPSDQEAERKRLAETYASLNDAGLMELADDPKALTDLARGVLRIEMEHRGLNTDLLDPLPEAEEVKISELVTIRIFRDPPEALFAKTLLESSGIECCLTDENMIGLNWLISNAIGNMKLQVREEDAEAALEILDQPVEEVVDIKDEE
jgi:hypothetical protein